MPRWSQVYTPSHTSPCFTYVHKLYFFSNLRAVVIFCHAIYDCFHVVCRQSRSIQVELQFGEENWRTRGKCHGIYGQREWQKLPLFVCFFFFNLKSKIVIVIVIVSFLGQFCPRGKGAVRLTQCEAPTHETRLGHNTGSYVPYSFL